MNIIENFREGVAALKTNLLRSILTAAIIAIGIMALVGMLTAVEGIQQNIESSLSSLGAGSFEISTKSFRSGSTQGRTEKRFPAVRYRELAEFKDQYYYPGTTVCIFANITGSAEVKRLSKATDPNVLISAGDENYLQMEDLNLERGRNFSNTELEYGVNVAIIGQEVKEELFDPGEDPINQTIAAYGNRYKVIGVFEQKGGFGPGGGPDRTIVIPIEAGRKVENRRGSGLFYRLAVILEAGTVPEEIDFAMAEAQGLFRSIRQDPLGQPDSFEIEKQESLSESLEEVTTILRTAGVIIGLVTLLGASIGLMNIMLVSVTERTREIGVRKAIGATPAKIRQQFLIEAIVVCLLGGIGGIFLGLIVGNLISVFALQSAFTIPLVWIVMGVVVCIVVGTLAGLIPATRASKLDPIESLRYE